MGTLSHVYKEPKPLAGLENRPKSSQDVLLLYLCQHLLLFQFSKHKLVRTTSTLSSSDTTTDFDSVSDDDDGLHITLRKSKHTCASHPISRFVSYSHLSPFSHVFISSLNLYYVFKYVSEALFIPGWKDAIKEEMLVLE